MGAARTPVRHVCCHAARKSPFVLNYLPQTELPISASNLLGGWPELACDCNCRSVPERVHACAIARAHLFPPFVLKKKIPDLLEIPSFPPLR